MTLLFMDSFDHYDTAQVGTKYTSGGGVIDTTTKRTGRGSLQLTGGSGVLKNLDANTATVIIGFAYRTTIFNGFIARLGDANTYQVYLELNLNGTINIVRGNGSVIATSVLSLQTNQWYYIELKVVFSDTGSAVLRVNEVEWINANPADTTQTTNNYANFFQLIGVGAGGSCYFDDLYVCNSSGSVNNDFLGDVQVEAIMPNADGSQNDWTPSAAADHYTLVDEIPPATADYISSSNAGDIDLYAFPDLSIITGAILGIQVCAYEEKDDAEARVTRAKWKRAGAVQNLGAANISVTTSYKYDLFIQETNPDDAAAFEIADINAGEMGIELVS